MSKDLTLTATVAAALMSLSYCSSPKNGWDDVVSDSDTAVCVDRDGRRIYDEDCRSSGYVGGSGYYSSGARWFYMGRNAPVPLYGDSVDDERFRRSGSFAPQSGVQYRSAPSAANMFRSQAVSRGGLGSSGFRFGGGWS